MKKTYLYLAVLLSGALSITACSNLDESAYKPTNNTGETIILSSEFKSDMGGFTTQNVSGEQMWALNSSGYVMMTGYVSSVNNANEDWLISPEIDLSTVTSAHLSFDHVTRYFANLSAEATVWISTNYVTDSLPATAIWTQITTKTFSDPGSWTFVGSDDISLNAYAGQKVRIAFKYISTSAKAGTWELKNFVVKTGDAVINNYGKGTKESPYTVTGATMNQAGTSAWVKGYIVGYAWYANSTNQFYFTGDTCTQATNILIADSMSNVYLSKCIAVQLPTGVVRTGLNLKDMKANYGKQVTLYGGLMSYFGMAGIKNTSYYMLEDSTSGGTMPVEAIYSETFANSSKGGFTIQNVNLPAGLTYVWTPTASYGMTGSGYKSPTDYASESWLISPAIDLSKVSSASLMFDHALNYVSTLANKQMYASVWVSTDYKSGLPSTGTWTQVTIPTYPAGSNWTFVSSGVANLSSVAGKSGVRIAFKYVSIAGDAATWEVKNVIVY